MSIVKTGGAGVGPGASATREGSPVENMRKLQDAYSEREVDQNKKHREELISVTENHREELQKVQDQHERTIRDFKSKADDTVTKQDMSYQKEIKDLKDMYNRRIERLALQNKKATENGTET